MWDKIATALWGERHTIVVTEPTNIVGELDNAEVSRIEDRGQALGSLMHDTAARHEGVRPARIRLVSTPDEVVASIDVRTHEPQLLKALVGEISQRTMLAARLERNVLGSLR